MTNDADVAFVPTAAFILKKNTFRDYLVVPKWNYFQRNESRK